MKQQNIRGFSIIELLIVVVVIGIIAAIAVPSLLKSRRAANEAAAISTIRLITRAEVAYRFASQTDTFGTMPELYAAKHLEDSLGIAPHIKIGFSYSVTTIPASGVNPPRFTALANPVIHSLTNSITGTGSRNFGSTETGSIHQTVDGTPVTFDLITRIPTGSTYLLEN